MGFEILNTFLKRHLFSPSEIVAEIISFCELNVILQHFYPGAHHILWSSEGRVYKCVVDSEVILLAMCKFERVWVWYSSCNVILQTCAANCGGRIYL